MGGGGNSHFAFTVGTTQKIDTRSIVHRVEMKSKDVTVILRFQNMAISRSKVMKYS